MNVSATEVIIAHYDENYLSFHLLKFLFFWLIYLHGGMPCTLEKAL